MTGSVNIDVLQTFFINAAEAGIPIYLVRNIMLKVWRPALIAGTLVAAACSGAHGPAQLPAVTGSSTSSTTHAAPVRTDAGDILIGDQFNNRVIQVDRNHQIDWHFGDGSSKAGPASIVAPNDEERFGNFTLIAGTGAPQGSEPSCMQAACPDDRAIIVDLGGHIVWQYGKAGVGGSGPNELNTPVCTVRLPNGHILITDQVNERVIEVDKAKNIDWQYGMTGVSGSGFNQLNNPNSAELLPNGHILIGDENNNRVIEVDRDSHKIVWQYGNPNSPKTLNGAAFASRLDNGDTLITDSNNNRVLEVNHDKDIVWSYVTNKRAGSVQMPLPTRAVRLGNGNTMISDQFNHQVIVVDPNKNVVFAQGKIATMGKTFDRLNAPYDAKVIGDFTGLTPPGDVSVPVK